MEANLASRHPLVHFQCFEGIVPSQAWEKRRESVLKYKYAHVSSLLKFYLSEIRTISMFFKLAQMFKSKS